jgi:filamentous hemagglutinin
VIPQNVTGIQDASRLQTLAVSGNLINAGVIQVLSQSAQTNSANISAPNITNQQTGVITSVLPTAGILGFTPALANVHLSLTALQNILNSGIISSSGNLTMVAGASITNALPTGLTGPVPVSVPSPVMQALNNLNLTASTGNITNMGSISSLASNVNLSAANIINSGNITSASNLIATAGGNITNQSVNGIQAVMSAQNLNIFSGSGNIVNSGLMQGVDSVNLTSAANQALNINNTGGLMQALNGAINIRDASYTGSAGRNIVGGVLDGPSVNIYNGTGAVSAQVEQVTGKLNVTGGSSNISVVGPRVLVLGTLNLSSDPIITSGNDILVSGDTTVSSGDLIVTSLMGNILGPTDPTTPATVQNTDPNGQIQFNAVQGSILLSNVTISAVKVVPIGTGPDGLIPSSVQLAAHGDVTVGNIISPAGSVTVASGCNFSNGIFFPAMNPGNVQVGTIDLSSKNIPNHGLIYLAAGSALTAGAMNANGGLVQISSQDTVTLTGLTATGKIAPAIINDSVNQTATLTQITAVNRITIGSPAISARGGA